MKQYVGYSLDNSGSMRGVADAAMKDYNAKVADLKEAAIRYGVDTVVSVVNCSIKETRYSETRNKWLLQNSTVSAVRPLQEYSSNGGDTQLFDSVNMLIDAFLAVPDYNTTGVGFLIDAVTDGIDNASNIKGHVLAERIKELQKTDKWTITFRVPNGMKRNLVQLGIPAANIMEFNASDAVAFQAASVMTQAATRTLYEGKLRGVHGVSTFYANLGEIKPEEVKKELTNISKQVKVIPVAQDWNGKQIRDFVENKIGQYILGTVHYQLTKKEEVQEGKRIVVWDRTTGYYYTGADARSILKLPATGKIRLQPGTESNRFEIFVQSNSVNRKLVSGTKVVILSD